MTQRLINHKKKSLINYSKIIILCDYEKDYDESWKTISIKIKYVPMKMVKYRKGAD